MWWLILMMPVLSYASCGDIQEGEHIMSCPPDQIGFINVTCSDGALTNVSTCESCASGLSPNEDQTQCLDGCGIPNGDGNSCRDLCWIQNGDNSECKDCAGTINGTLVVDACGLCGGDNSTCCDGNPCNEEGTEECLGGSSSFDCKCKDGYTGPYCSIQVDCDGNVNGTLVVDACGWCGGDNSTCCEGNPCNEEGTEECFGGSSSFDCRCKDGYTGPYCEIKELRDECNTTDRVAYINNQCCSC